MPYAHRTIVALPTVVVLSAVLALGCGGDDGAGLDTTPLSSASFSPSSATRPDGKPASRLWWRYRVNHGEPVSASFEGVSISVPFDDVLMTVDTRSQHRSARASGPISGFAEGFELSGSYTATSEQSLRVDEQTFLLDDRLRAEVRLSLAGESAAVVADVTGSYDPPIPWFLDSSELDNLPQGFSETVNPSGHASGTVEVSVTGFPKETANIDERVTGSETWTVVEHMPSRKVLGTEYRDVVRVDRRTTAPDPLTGSPTPTTIVYWVARGVGIIEAENIMRFLDTPLTWELVATNLVPNGDGGGGSAGSGGSVGTGGSGGSGWVGTGGRVSFEDNFDDGELDPLWLATGECFVPVETGGQLVMTKSDGCSGGGSAALNQVARPVVGDFEVTVDFDLQSFSVPLTASRWASLSVRKISDGSPVGWIDRYNRFEPILACPPSTMSYKAWTTISIDCDPSVAWAATDHMQGRFRITRQGTQVTMSYWDAGQWQTLKSAPVTDEDLVVSLNASSWIGDTGGFDVRFDNFVLIDESSE